jgi:hypothetical protein
MHPFLLFAAVSGSIAGATAAPVPLDVHGITLASGRSEAHAVVWLDASAGPAPTQASKVVDDQRNLDFSPHLLAVRVGTVVEFPNKSAGPPLQCPTSVDMGLTYPPRSKSKG